MATLYLSGLHIFFTVLQTCRTYLHTPDLHALAPRAHVFTQQQVVESDGADDVELLLDHLFDELGVGSVLTHDGVEGIELADDGVQRVRPFISNTGCPLTETRGLHPRHALDGFMFQHARDCREQQQTEG